MHKHVPFSIRQTKRLSLSKTGTSISINTAVNKLSICYAYKSDAASLRATFAKRYSQRSLAAISTLFD